MCACDQSSICSIGGKFRPDYGLLLELHSLTLVARSYALLLMVVCLSRVLFIASHGTQLVVRIVEVFNSCLVTAHSQLKVRVCNVGKKKKKN